MLNDIISVRGCIISFILLTQFMFNQFLGHFSYLIHCSVLSPSFNEVPINVSNNNTYFQTNKATNMNKQILQHT